MQPLSTLVLRFSEKPDPATSIGHSRVRFITADLEAVPKIDEQSTLAIDANQRMGIADRKINGHAEEHWESECQLDRSFQSTARFANRDTIRLCATSLDQNAWGNGI